MLHRTQTVQEIAELRNVDEQTVGNWAKQGCPHSRRGTRPYFNEGEILAWLQSQGRTGAPGRPGEKAVHDENSKDYWLARKYKNQCLRDEGQLIDVDAVRAWAAKHFGTFKGRLLGFASGVTPQLDGRDGAERQSIIETQIHDILNELADGIKSVA